MAESVPLNVAEQALEDLVNARNMDDIVKEVCEQTDMDSEQATKRPSCLRCFF